jgi:hypothetical protein
MKSPLEKEDFLISEARDFLKEIYQDEDDQEAIDTMKPHKLMDLIEREYDGGIYGFVKACYF